MITQKCPECSKNLAVRNGKFGEFVCCPSGHGTFSIQDGQMYYKGSVGKMFAEQRIRDVYEVLEARLSNVSSGYKFQPTLTQLMNAQMANWGWNSGGEMEQLAEFAVGTPETVWDEEELDDPNKWWNVRNY